MQWIYHVIRHALVQYGYWAVIAGLIAENAGLPVPGETTLMFASFLANKIQQLQLPWVIIAAIFLTSRLPRTFSAVAEEPPFSSLVSSSAFAQLLDRSPECWA
jgi:hypothetical protein